MSKCFRIDAFVASVVLNAFQQTNGGGFLHVRVAQNMPMLHDLKDRRKLIDSASFQTLYEVAGKISE